MYQEQINILPPPPKGGRFGEDNFLKLIIGLHPIIEGISVVGGFNIA